MNEEGHHEKTFLNIFNIIDDKKEAHADAYLFDTEVSWVSYSFSGVSCFS
ncbi:MAG: hypothetical protein H6Q74_2578 [Firmicutes bacterium]|nr:hypothetical protein [Bacillota bacterium]